ncbi:mucin 68d [Diplodia corticola]|uniref:Mucin 68d n=1 Tax=Diplodia corticola TaxID=236234 RepID=A0A1J9S976_9PEZI|nr:mucin 68d [Diplodia corticola]OJD36133.1 mucin 68d [Diplodia corticola]
MVDKQPSLRQRILRGRRTSSDSDSASDSSHSKKDLASSANSLSPAQPVARPPSRSPSARVPKKLQKKRSSTDSLAASPSLMPFQEQHDKPSGSEATESADLGRSRADGRRQERRKLETIGPRLTVNTSSLAEDSYEEHGDGLSLMEVSPLSINKESPMSELMDEGNSEPRKSGGLALDEKTDLLIFDHLPSFTIRLPDSTVDVSLTVNLAINTPDYNDPNPRVGRLTALARARVKALQKLRAQSPVSPPRDRENKTRDSPVSPLEDSSDGSSTDQDAPLLPHERMETPSKTGESSSATKYLGPASAGKLRKKPSTKSKIPTLKLNTKTTASTDATNERDNNAEHQDSKAEEDAANIRHDAIAAENALLETLRRLTSRKQPTTDTEIRAATDEVLRTAASVLDLGPRSPVPPSSSQPRSPSSSTAGQLLPPAPEVPDVPTANPPHSPTCGCGGTGTGADTGSRRSLLEDVNEEDDATDKHVQQQQQHRGHGRLPGRKRQQAAVGSERVRHPVNVTYDRPIMLAAGVSQRGFRRWKCCRCHRYTHYENHVCSKLDCLHARCETRCETFEP